MAKNAGAIEQYAPINVYLPVTEGGVSGDVQALNDMVVYLQTDRDAAGYATVTIPCYHVQVVEVVAVNHAGNSAVAVGDLLYVDTGVINKDSTDGVEFGYALDAIDAGDTADIRVGFGM